MHNQNIPDSKDKGNLEFRMVTWLGNVMQNTKEDSEEDLELYGTSPRVIAILLGMVTLFFPVGGIGLIYNWTHMQPLIFGVTWLVPPGGIFYGFIFYLIHPVELLGTIWMTVPLCAFNLLFVYQTIRWFNGNTSRDIVLFYGILSMLAPTAITLALWVTIDFGFIITPFPFQFLAGIILLYKFRDPDYTSPWEGYFLDWSWWIRQRHSIHDPNTKVINLTKLLLQHDADWLDGWLDEDERG